MKVPHLEPIQFLLSVPALVGRRTPAVPEISIDPLLPEHRDKRGEERGRKAGVEQRLDGNNSRRRARPGDGAGVCVGEERTVHGMDEDLHVRGSHIVRVRLEFWLYIDDECRTDRGEQAGLRTSGFSFQRGA